MTDWAYFQEILLDFSHSGQPISFWWREDDVACDSKNLVIILDLLLKYKIPVLCGVIPNLLTNDVIQILKSHPNSIVCQHGLNHQNNYTIDYKCEFDSADSLGALIAGRTMLKDMFQNKFLPVYIPPWNNISKSFKGILLDNGYVAVSGYNYSAMNKRPYNVDVDLIDWNKSESFSDDSFVMKLLLQCFSRKDFNVGIVNHHRTIGIEGIKFIEKLLSETHKYSNISWKIPF